jgi:hypothetical protein
MLLDSQFSRLSLVGAQMNEQMTGPTAQDLFRHLKELLKLKLEEDQPPLHRTP